MFEVLPAERPLQGLHWRGRSLLSSVPYMEMGMGIGTIERQLRAEADTYVAVHGTF